jgi:acetyl esterase/lipase
MTAVMGGQANFSATSPTSYIRADLPPMLLIHGDADETVPLSMSQDFVTALKHAGVKADLHVYPGRGHSELLFYTLTQNPGNSSVMWLISLINARNFGVVLYVVSLLWCLTVRVREPASARLPSSCGATRVANADEGWWVHMR